MKTDDDTIQTEEKLNIAEQPIKDTNKASRNESAQ
jgi:hypothetical protein